jgi:hypothetical protein
MDLEVITLVVTIGGILLAATPLLNVCRALSSIGHNGQFWFDHSVEQDLAARPSEDANDAPLPRRRIRARY